MGSTTANIALGRAMSEARMSNNGLARRVRELAAARGARSSADHVAVKRWLDGTQPKAETAMLIAAPLSEKLRRTITPAGLGFTAGPVADHSRNSSVEPVVYPDDADTATDGLDSVADADAAGVLVPGPEAWDRFATPSIITGYLFDGHSEHRRLDAGDGPLDAEAIRLTTARLMELDFQLGGGHTRELLLFYFRSQVLPLLQSLPRGAQRSDILSATAELAQMLGWSAYDAGRHAAAQRYLVYGLRLARDAGDVLLGARLLSNLSHQANYLGRFRDSVQLARAAISTSVDIPAPATLALLHAMEARALASLSDGAGASRALERAEVSLHRGGDADPPWISYFDPAELAGEAAHCFRDLGKGEEARHFAGLAVASPTTPPRTRAFINMVTAAGALQQGSLDEAIVVAREAIELAGPLQSSRYRRYVSDFVRQVTEAHPRDPRAVELAVLTDPVLRTPVGK
ncbi:hypothetical protein EV383_6014 [Pseudonocardia sediminis]|uniref:Transcriptional regulator n=2 Tax=Pseudonocardia sediminis TaxID=1397368 RepID=A0A4Q7V8D0_PSEST|nr:hypothetical protein EV383_6014 [Pseudonocardia sediminis]